MDNVSDDVASQVQASFRELAKNASHLNSVSDRLGKYVSEIEQALKTINLGVASWVVVEETKSINGHEITIREIGYDKIAKNWSIALRSRTEAEWSDEFLEYEAWIFNEGPRWLRIKAIDHLPKLIEKLSAEAVTITKHVTAKLPIAANVASQITSVIKPKTEEGKGR